MSQTSITQRDIFQVRAFQTVFKINRSAGKSADEAFAIGIGATSDNRCEKALRDDPKAFAKWEQLHRIYKRSRKEVPI